MRAEIPNAHTHMHEQTHPCNLVLKQAHMRTRSLARQQYTPSTDTTAGRQRFFRFLVQAHYPLQQLRAAAVLHLQPPRHLHQRAAHARGLAAAAGRSGERCRPMCRYGLFFGASLMSLS